MNYYYLRKLLKKTLSNIYEISKILIHLLIKSTFLLAKLLKKLWMNIIRPLSLGVLRLKREQVFVLVVFFGLTWILAFGDSGSQRHRMPTVQAGHNEQGEKHPDLYTSESLDDWVSKHCDVQTILIKDKIKWYAKYKKIKPEVVFAISWADTQCGAKMATRHNYGNVGNNDRGTRVGFNSAFEGWQAIVDTLNNKYLKGNTVVGQLSGGGRKQIGSKYSCANAIIPYKCYATSFYNWQANTVRALRVIMKDDKIDNNYKIRI